MKKPLLKVLSVLLCVACLYGLVAGVLGMKDVMAAKAYWEGSGGEAIESFNKLADGISQLSENESAYVTGVGDYEKGTKDYEEGQKKYQDGLATYNAGEAELAAGADKLATGQAAYDENVDKLAAAHAKYDASVKQLEQGKKDLEQGKKDLEQGKKDLEDGKAAVAAGEAELAVGKEQLAQAKPIYDAVVPLYNQYRDNKQAAEDARARGDLISAAIYEGKASDWETAMKLQLGDYSIEGIVSEYEAGQAKVAAGEAELAAGKEQVAAGEKQVAEGEATIAAGEKKIADSEKQLADAKKVLDANDAKLADANKELQNGYADYNSGKAELAAGAADLANGKKDLEDGAKKLADGLTKLGEYEGGVEQVVEGLDLVLATETYCDTKGEALLPSIAERLGEDFTYWKLNEKKEIVTMDGKQYLDLSKAMQVVDAGRAFLDDTTQLVTKELTGRLVVIIALMAASVIGIVAAVLGFFGLKAGWILGIVSAAVAAAGIVISLVNGIECPLSVIAGSTKVSYVIEMALIAALSVALTVVGFAAKKNAATIDMEETA